MKKILIIVLLIPIIGLSQICGHDQLIQAKKTNESFINNYEYIHRK